MTFPWPSRLCRKSTISTSSIARASQDFGKHAQGDATAQRIGAVVGAHPYHRANLVHHAGVSPVWTIGRSYPPADAPRSFCCDSAGTGSDPAGLLPRGRGRGGWFRRPGAAAGRFTLLFLCPILTYILVRSSVKRSAFEGCWPATAREKRTLQKLE